MCLDGYAGFFEDKMVVDLNRKLTWSMITLNQYKKEMIKFFEGMKKFKRWGFKDPRMILGLPWIVEYLKPTVIRTYRDREMVVASLIQNLNWDRALAEMTHDGQTKLLDDYLKDIDVIEVHYGDRRMTKSELISILKMGCEERETVFIKECFDDVRQTLALGGY